jgi:Flp pilus assembly protein TadD
MLSGTAPAAVLLVFWTLALSVVSGSILVWFRHLTGSTATVAQAETDHTPVAAPVADDEARDKRLIGRMTKEEVAALSKEDKKRRNELKKQASEERKASRSPEEQAKIDAMVADAEEHLARGRFQDALTAYKQVMPYQPDNARLRAGMAWTMIRLNRQPMADNVWKVAAQNPDAISALGDSLKSKGDVEGAKAVWQRLKDTVPTYAPKLEGKL